MDGKKADGGENQKHRGGQVSFKVSPELLLQQSERLLQAAGETEQLLQEIDNILKKTGFYWLGRAAQAHRKVFANRKQRADRLVETLRDHAHRLCGMAGVYQGAEETSESEALELPTDVLS